MSHLHLRNLTNADIDLLTIWLNKPHVKKWFHNPENWLKEVHARQTTYSWIQHFIVMDCETPIGFCQYYDCYNAKDLEDWFHVTKKNDTYSIDYLIGDEKHLGKGFGKDIVKLLTEKIAEKETARRIIVQPEKENQPSNHVLLANGFLFDEEKDYFVKLLR